MSNVPFLSLPAELIHRICDSLDVQSIIRSLRCTCKQLYASVNTYNRFKFNFTSCSKSDFEVLSRLIQAEQVVSLTFSKDYKTKFDQTDLFCSIFNLDQFTRLRSLAFHQIEYIKLAQFIPHIVMYPLVSLSVDTHVREKDCSHMIAFISAAIGIPSLQKLHLDVFDCIIKHISWPVQCTLQHLRIGRCTYHEYYFILRHVPNLKTFIATHWITGDADEIPSTDLLHLQLTSLTVHHRIPIEYVSSLPLLTPSLLLLTPSLVYLNLVSDRSTLDFVFDGDFWQTFIQTNLPLLEKFEFIFAFELRRNSDTPSLESIIAPFRKPFWLNDKGWLVTCDYVMNSSRISLHSIPDYHVYGKIFRCEASLMNGVRFLDGTSENRKVDNDSKHMVSTINFDRDRIGDRVTYLADALRQSNTTLTTLKLRHNNISSKGAECLFDALQHNTVLTTLDIGNNQIGVEGALHLANLIKNTMTLTTLHLYDNEIGDQGIEHLANALQHNTTLTKLHLRVYQIQAVGAEYIANALKHNTTLTTLDLSGNAIGDKGTEHLANALQHNMTLSIFYLCGNKIGAVGAEHLANALQHNTTLTALYLRANRIGDKGAEHMANALQHNMTLTTLHLCSNQIGAIGAKHLADALQNNTAITTLELGYNRILDEGAKHLANTLRHNKSLTKFNIHFNEILADGAECLAQALQNNTTLTTLDISGNDIGDVLQERINQLLQKIAQL